jgi:YggT family protein
MLEIIIQTISQVIYILVLIKIVLSYFMDPYHPIRQSIDRLIDPLLKPIQQVLPVMGGFDFSPLVLILIVEVLSRVLLSIL